MNKKISCMFFALGTFVLSGSYALASDEFVVDLSVLNDVSAESKTYELAVPAQTDNNHPLLIGNNPKQGGSVSSILNLPPLEPKFPVVTKKVAPKVVKAKKVKPVTKPKPVVEKKVVEPVIVEEPVIVPEIIEIAEPLVENVSEKTVVYEFDENENVLDSSDNVVEEENIVPEVVETEVIMPEMIEPESVETEVIEPESVEIEVIEPEVAPVLQTDGIISFGKDNSEITEEDKNKIDLIVASFEDARTNKISIVSYNVETSGISFKNKRQSLARATNIRSYLISRGYKNFDIKVAEISENSEMIDCVLVSEIK